MVVRATEIHGNVLHPIRDFYSWWTSNIADFLSDLTSNSRTRFLVFNDDSYTIFKPSAADGELRRVEKRDEKTFSQASEIILRLGEEQVLRQVLTLPRGAGDVLELVVRNQLERTTPWTSDQLRFGYRIIDTEEPDPRNLLVETAATSEKILNKALEQARLFGFEPDRVEFLSEQDRSGPIAILGIGSRRRQELGEKLRRIIATAAAIVALLGLVGSVKWYNAFAESRQIQTEIADIRGQVASIEQQQVKYDALIKQCEDLIKERMSQPATVLVIEELTRALPDNAYLEELIINSDDLQVRGHASDAASLIPLIERSQWFENVQFADSTTRKQGGSDEVFAISAKLVAVTAKADQ